MICPFCNKEMISRKYSLHFEYYKCLNHSPCLVMIRTEVPHEINSLQFIICKEQFEIRYDKNSGFTTLLLYSEEMRKDNHSPAAQKGFFCFNDWIYTTPNFKLVSVPKKFNVTPNNFDFYLNKLKTFVVFS